ncbi:MAG: EF-P lysine aminoacylase EpmA [Bdellovibrio sp.]
MTREQLLAQANYPTFQVGPRKLCLKLQAVELKKLRFHDGSALKFAPTARLEFAGSQGSVADLLSLFRVHDWVGVELDAQRRILHLGLLAPHLAEAAPLTVSTQTLQQWTQFLKSVRQFFERRDFLEVQTPTLVICPGTEPHLDPFTTEFKMGRRQERFFLPTSPELHLKKLVAAGYGSVFEIRSCFRNGEISDHHQPEFLMLEWYRPGADLSVIRKDCLDLIRFLQKSMKRPLSKKATDVTMRDLFAQETGFELKVTTTAKELILLAKKLGLQIQESSDFDDAFYQIFLEKIEPRLSSKSPLFVAEYPPSQAALARLTPEGWGDRFELYWKGMELANAYHELNDPKIQRERSAQDVQKKAELGKGAVTLDEDFFRALESGMPPTAGIALGLERLFMALTDLSRLQELRLFPMKNS